MLGWDKSIGGLWMDGWDLSCRMGKNMRILMSHDFGISVWNSSFNKLPRKDKLLKLLPCREKTTWMNSFSVGAHEDATSDVDK
jgi:hypothetical protein